MRRRRWHDHSHVCAFTLVEVLLALTITGLVGLAVVTMLSAASYGATSRAGMRDLLVVSRTTSARLGVCIRTAVEVVSVDAGGEYIVLWVQDTNEDSTRQYDELQLIERNTVANELRSYATTSDATAFTTAAAFRTTALASFTAQTWATGITDIEFKQIAASGEQGPLVTWRLTAARDDVSDVASGAAAVRNTTPEP